MLFQFAIDAMHQLRTYWLPRYLSEKIPRVRSKWKQPIIESTPIEEDPETDLSSENLNPIVREFQFVKHTLKNISYLDYNPREYIPIQPNLEHDFQQDTEDLDELPTNTSQDETIKSEEILFPSSNRSIADYANDENIELFYRIFISDSLAGWPFLEYITQMIPKEKIGLYQTYIRFLTDGEILFSIRSGKFREKIVKEFIFRYNESTED